MPGSLPGYLTSGASSRAHHSLLVKLEGAASEQEQDDIVASELERCRQVIKGGTSSAKVADTLVIVLHCTMLRRVRQGGGEDWALVAALDLAERGRTLRERKMGYTFLAERMPRGHELELLLINTIRKDLTSTRAQDILLGLGMVVKLPSDDLEPAVSPILVSRALLKHPNAAVRQRTLLALHALYLSLSPDVNRKARASPGDRRFPLSMGKLVRLLRGEEDVSVKAVLLRLIKDALLSGTHAIGTADEGTYILDSVIDAVEYSRGQLRLEAVRTMGAVVLSSQDSPTDRVEQLIADGLSGSDGAFLLEACRISPSTRSTHLDDLSLRRISRLLLPNDPSGSAIPAAVPANDHILAIRCLTALPREVWDGKLGEAEMSVIMQGTQHGDESVRRATLRLLDTLDASLLDTCFQTHLHHLRNTTSSKRERAGEQALEIAEIIITRSDGLGFEVGQQLARRVMELLDAWHEGSGETPASVWEFGVRRVLGLLREVTSEAAAAFAREILVSSTNTPKKHPHKSESHVGFDPTLAVLRATVACDTARLDVADTERALTILLNDLRGAPGSVQELLLVGLVALLRDATPDSRARLSDVVVHDLRQQQDGMSKYARKRCRQVLSVLDHDTLDSVTAMAKSRSLPDLLAAIIDAAATIKAVVTSPVEETSFSSPRPRQAMSESRLRYDAYEVPSPSRSARQGRSVAVFNAVPLRPSMNGVIPMSAGELTLMDEDERQDVSLQLPTASDRLGLDLNGMTLGEPAPRKPSPQRRQSNDPFTSSPI